MSLTIFRLLRNNPLMDLFGEPLLDRDVPITLFSQIRNAVRNVPADQMDELLLHGTAIAKALKEEHEDGLLRLAKEDHEWLQKTLKAKPLFTAAFAQDALDRALRDYTELSAESA